MYRNLAVAMVVAVSCLSAAKADDLKVRHPIIELGEFEVDHNSTTTFDRTKSGKSNNQTHATELELRQGLLGSLRMGSDRRRRCLHHGPLDDDAGGRVPPQGDEKLARQGDDDCLAHPPAKAPDPLVEPQAERRGRLVLQP